MSEIAHDRAVISAFRALDGKKTLAVLDDGRRLVVLNVALGYDIGDTSAHITTNISPSPDPSLPIDFFYTSAVVELLDLESGASLFVRAS